MIYGVISDTHGNFAAVRDALTLFTSLGIKTILHAGDFGEPALMGLFSGFQVFLASGNGDVLDRLEMESLQYPNVTAKKVHELIVEDDPGRQQKIFVMHGDDSGLYRNALANHPAYLVKGHSHMFEDYRRGNTRVINPGALSRCPVYTVGILDTANDNWIRMEI